LASRSSGSGSNRIRKFAKKLEEAGHQHLNGSLMLDMGLLLELANANKLSNRDMEEEDIGIDEDKEEGWNFS
jgi:hypothetical protein